MKITKGEPDLFEFSAVGGESEEDIPAGLSNVVSKAVLWSTDWTIETIFSQLSKGNIELNPEFQRREAWGDDKKSLFIESILIGLPIPQIVLAERKDRPGSYLVIDGKQRLLTLRKFCANHEDTTFTTFSLKGLTIRSDLNGSTLEELNSNPTFSNDARVFENQTIRTTIIRNWPNEDFLYTVFLRLNTGSLPLSPQELRQALHPGPFLTYADEFTRNSLEFHQVFGRTSPDFRMRDVELFVRHIAFRLRSPEYRGNLKQFLDKTCQELSEQWKSWETTIHLESKKLASAISTTHDIFGAHCAFRKWSGSNYETRFNRAIFDIMTYYFANLNKPLKKAQKEAISNAFKTLCEDDDEFRKSIESTTKSLQATSTRFAKWAEALSAALGTYIQPAKIGPGTF